MLNITIGRAMPPYLKKATLNVGANLGSDFKF